MNCVNPGLVITNMTAWVKGTDFDHSYLERSSLEGHVGKYVMAGIHVL